MNIQTQNKSALKVPRIYKRRPYKDDKPSSGYLESFVDYACNNESAVEWFLENHGQIREVINVHAELKVALSQTLASLNSLSHSVFSQKAPLDMLIDPRESRVIQEARALLTKLT